MRSALALAGAARPCDVRNGCDADAPAASRRDPLRLVDLLARERAALGDILVALAEFDERRLWVDLGYTSLFDFLHRELRLSKGAALYRKTAVELIHRFDEVVAIARLLPCGRRERSWSPVIPAASNWCSHL